MALQTLERLGVNAAQARSKSWEEFAAPTAPTMDFVFTVCDNAAGEVCPVWPGQPISAHWGVADPAAASGDAEKMHRAFNDAFSVLSRRISLFMCLPIDKLSRLADQARVRAQTTPESVGESGAADAGCPAHRTACQGGEALGRAVLQVLGGTPSAARG